MGTPSRKEIRLPFAKIRDPQTITEVQEAAFAEQGLNTHHHEVDELIDDHSTQTRVLKVRGPRTFFDMGRGRR